MPCGGFGERVVNTMAESKNYIVQPQEGGNILISEDVIASIGIEPCKLCTYCWNGKE